MVFTQQVVRRGVGLAGQGDSGAYFRDTQQGVTEGDGLAWLHAAKARQHARLAPGHGRQVRVVTGDQAVAAKMQVQVLRHGFDNA